MKWWPFSRRRQEQGEDLDDAIRLAERTLRDAKQLHCRADDVTGRLADTWSRNHIAQAVADTIRGKLS